MTALTIRQVSQEELPVPYGERVRGRAERTQPPFVSVVIPALDEAGHIADSLASVVAQTYPHDRMEVIVADGGSTDMTRDIVAEWSARHPFIRLIDNPARIQAAGLNRAIQASRGDVIARLDAHAAWPPHHLTRCVELLEETGADNVGGTMQVISETALGKAIGCATSSPFGIGGARYRYAKRQQEVDTVWLGCMRRSALDRVGLYDESLAVHEDYELNYRIRSSGGRVVFSPALPTSYWPRDSWRALARQYFRYGRAKALVARRTADVMRPHHFVPPTVVAATPLVLLAATTNRRARRPATILGTAYSMACIFAGLQSTHGHRIAVRIRVPLVFPVLHASWGTGFWAGMCSTE